MHIDDRLATVLNARTDGRVAMRIQYRQLLDLVGTSAAEARGDLMDAAHIRLNELAALIPPDERARMLAEPGVRLRNPRLVVDLAGDHPSVALAAIRGARLAEEQWLDLVPALPLASRGLLRHRRDLGPAVEARLEQLGITDRALPGVDAGDPSQPAPDIAEPRLAGGNILRLAPRDEGAAAAAAIQRPFSGPAADEVDGIGAIVRRIEAFCKNRETSEGLRSAHDAPRLPLGENDDDDEAGQRRIVQAFSFATDAAGRIGWADVSVAGMVGGLLLTAIRELDEAETPLDELFRRRLPIRAAVAELDGAPPIAGPWQIDAGPEFDEAGHFIGYVGRFRRPSTSDGHQAPGAEADRIRQILHELRTPVNAIQGFAEMIHQQLFGVAPHEYRALAASIAADAARMLAGFEELDRLARLDSGALELNAGESDIATIVAGIVHQLEAHTGPRGSGFELVADEGVLIVPLAPEEAERFSWRLLGTLAGATAPGETIRLELRRVMLFGGLPAIELEARLPSALARLEDPFDAAPPETDQAVNTGMFGSGFALRLSAAEARAGGGKLEIGAGTLRLTLPAKVPGPQIGGPNHAAITR